MSGDGMRAVTVRRPAPGLVGRIWRGLGHPVVSLASVFCALYCVVGVYYAERREGRGFEEAPQPRARRKNDLGAAALVALDGWMYANESTLQSLSVMRDMRNDAVARDEYIAQLRAVKDELGASRLAAREEMVPSALIPENSVDVEVMMQHSFAKRLIVSQRLRAVYCPIPKVASTNFKRLIRKFEGFSDHQNLTRAHSSDSGLVRLSELAPELARQILEDRTYLKFVVVREPYSRALSCYLNKFHTRQISDPEFRRFLGQLVGWKYIGDAEVTEADRPTFARFVNAIWKQLPAQMNEHWAIQSVLCGIGVIPYDFVGRFEELPEHALLILRALGKSAESFPSPSEIGFLSTEANTQLDAFYTPALRSSVREIYHADFNLLEYAI
ncbi:Carbohydrate sulfotransferase 14 [Porphyridium purpureum]|uniref:Carbohydrate sulfotransferase 14 n=1 Tax=Porphyridium purpureum TaxID=35688 RepID=A0A5J4YLS8_PORPP|nr:Carbohydrate sulfotransferase 14 [Porphyridium purpureum]|eukprot:POR0779..scf295_9